MTMKKVFRRVSALSVSAVTVFLGLNSQAQTQRDFLEPRNPEKRNTEVIRSLVKHGYLLPLPDNSGFVINVEKVHFGSGDARVDMNLAKARQDLEQFSELMREAGVRGVIKIDAKDLTAMSNATQW